MKEEPWTMAKLDEISSSACDCCSDRRLRLRETVSSAELNTHTVTSQATCLANQTMKRKMVVVEGEVADTDDDGWVVGDIGGEIADDATGDASVESDASLVQPAWLQ